MKEPAHFRIKVPVGQLSETEDHELLQRDSSGVLAGRRHSRRCSKHEKKHLKELRRHVESFIAKQHSLPDAELHLTADKAFKRCCINIRIALRYLRNHERQSSYLGGLNPAVSPALTPVSKEL